MNGEEETVPEEHADESSGTGGADSPEEAVGEPPQEGQAERDEAEG